MLDYGTYKQKPVNVQALRLTEDAWNTSKPAWFSEAVAKQTIQLFGDPEKAEAMSALVYSKAAGLLKCDYADWIVLNMHDDFYVVADRVFIEDYSKVGD